MKMASKFLTTKIKAEILEGLYSDLEYKLKDATRYWGRTGEQKQKETYNSETKQYDPCFDDNGDPIMTDVYDDIEYTADELAEHPEVIAKVQVIQQLMKDLEKML